MKLGEAIYKSQQNAKPEDAPKDVKKEEKKDDNVVDADFEEVKDDNKEKAPKKQLFVYNMLWQKEIITMF